MKRKKMWTIYLAAALLITVSVAGYLSISAQYGDAEDPLVTLGYVNDVLSPQTMEKFQQELDSKKAEFSAELDAKMREAGDQLDAKLASYAGAAAEGSVSDELVNRIADIVYQKLTEQGVAATSSDGSWSVLRLEAGKKVTCKIGCEIVLRLGSATCISSGSTGPIDLSDATVLAPDAGYAENHLYLVTIEGRGLKAGSNGATILIKGDYSVN